MVKVALLIGVSEFADAALAPLPAALRDINAVQTALKTPEMGGFDEVRLLENPERQPMEEAIDALFRDRQKDDLVLLYFSGHGIKDDTGKFSLATRLTEKHRLRTTAVAASFVHEVMSSSRSRRQVVMLDCCFSGAFATGMMAKDDASVDVKAQLGGEGRAVLTASTATQYAFAQADEELSVYTRFLVEGIRTGAADTDNDGHITVDELHHYAQRKVQEAAPAMKPEIYAVKEGYTIQLAKAPLGDPTLEYRKEVELLANESNGEITLLDRAILDELRIELNLSQETAYAIETAVAQPYQQRQEKLKRYKNVLVQAIAHENPLKLGTRNKLKRLQTVLKLRDEDIASIVDRVEVSLDDSPVIESQTDAVLDSSDDTPPTSPSVPIQPSLPVQQSIPKTSTLKQRRLEEQRSMLQALWDMRMIKVEALRKALAAETGTTIYFFQLQKQLQAEDLELTQLTDRLDQVEQALSSEPPIVPSQPSSVTKVSAKSAPTIQVPTPHSPLPTPPSDDLSSDKGVDYTKLRDLLKAQQWKESDRETYLVMLQVLGRKDGDWIRTEEIQSFPFTDLHTIDQLWVKYSDGRFGFSVQKQIYLECGGKPDGSFDEKVWEKFGDRFGWRVNNTWISYSKVMDEPASQEGRLPYWCLCWIGWGKGARISTNRRVLGRLFSRVQSCKVDR
ncbi:MAG: GUN4 domain-containing protein [Stenomitos frigidus ULC029]